jgi:methyl-accepting chemotaxis protein
MAEREDVASAALDSVSQIPESSQIGARDMIKLNRIGYKLGLAGAVGVLLSIGMIGNQMITESAVGVVNELAAKQQEIADDSRAAEVSVRQLQQAGRNIRMTRTAAEVEKTVADIRQFKAAEDTQIDGALALAVNPATRERLQKIKATIADYTAGVEELAKVQSEIFQLTDKRMAISAEWEKAFTAQLASPALLALPSRQDVEILLNKVDSKVNGLRAAAWRLEVTGEESQKQVIASSTALLIENLDRIRGVADDKAFQSGIDALASIVSRFTAANDAVVKLGDARAEIIKNRTVTFVNQAIELIEAQVAFVGTNAKSSKALAIAETLQADHINFVLAIVVMAAIVGSVLFSFFAISRPMMRLNGALGEMAAGHLDIAIPGADRGDEIGDLAKTVTVIRENAEQKARDEAEAQTRQDQAAAKQRKADMIRMADDFEGAVGEIVETVSSASTELEASASTLTSTAERAQELTTMVAAASEEASTNVQSVASATEEMASSVNEISRQVQESARMAGDAVDQARKTNDRVSELSKAASRIGDVVELINTIAGQTNLLALNATIEAARAGEAGRGFAVVASEVKALAEQTAKATGEIGQQITGIQAATQESVNAIREISGTIEKLSEISSTIAAAVEQQGAATQEISRNVQQAAQGTQQVSANITDVQRGASETGTASSQVLSAAQSLSGDSNRLKLEVGKFLNSVRAA